MFKRTNFIAKYKQYAKSIKSLQVKSELESASTLGQKYLKFSESIKNVLSNTKSINSHKEVLSIINNKVADKIEKTKENCVNLSHTLRNNRFAKRSFSAAAVGIFKADPVTISGYSKHDYEILKQLGVIGDSTNASAVTPNASPTDLERVPDNATNTNTETLSSNAYNDYPPSLFEQQNHYTSIFDNMPEERNDIYTTLTNAFSSATDQSTQVASSDLQASSTDATPQINRHDYFVVETPGTEATSNAADTFGDGINDLLTTATNEASSHQVPASELVENNNVNAFATSTESTIVVEPIPEPPALPDLAADAASQLNVLGESTFASLGLGGWTPVGIVQNCFEYLHVTLGIPWWEAIAIGTLVIRFAMFPLVIMSQKNAARMNNHLPQMQIIQMKMTEARQTGNQMEVARYSQELMLFMKEKNLNPLKNMIVPLAQMPIFVSFFMGLREMANVPVDSLRTGGMFWFSDLTVPDQFFALPIITSLTLWATIELGTDSARLNSQNMQTMKYVLRALPFVILPFTVNFPGAILCYWVSSNFISLGQVGFLKIPAVRDYFKIDPMLKHDPTKLPIKNKGFVGGLKDSWTNMKITKELEERRRLDELQFHRAGKGPLVKTYKYDPTKQVKQVVKAKSAIKSSS